MILWQPVAAFVALQHVGFFGLESIAFRQDFGRKIFRLSREHAEILAPMAFNQGVYNLFLAAGLVWALACGDPGQARELAIFFFACVFIAGVVGGASVRWTILALQGAPAALGLALACFLH